MTTLPEHVDVLIVGAGISGVCAAYYLQNRCPSKTYAIVESREAMGGTWDLFKYPGIRSDSDLYTFGFSFRPWVDSHAFAGAAKIKRYVEDTAQENGIDKNIYFGRRAEQASFDSERALWTVKITSGGKTQSLTCRVLYMCSGYYDYAQGYAPDWPGTDDFKGQIIHPQSWPRDLDYAGKNVVVIGSGATAVTIVPALAETAAHVTMLQRSPSYIVEMPAEDKLANVTRKALGPKISHGINRWKNILRSMLQYNLSQKFPNFVKKQVMSLAQEAAGPDFDVGTHMNPSYNPWDQRVCVDKDGEMFAALKAGKASVVTDTITKFSKGGLELGSGERLDADVIVTATGLNIQMFGGMKVSVDDAPVNLADTYFYKAMMFSGVPNLFFSIGYTNASWTLKAELIARYACRLINEMDKTGHPIISPEVNADVDDMPAINLKSGYVFRAAGILPKQGEKTPWRVYQNYILDKISLGWGSLKDGAMTFKKNS